MACEKKVLEFANQVAAIFEVYASDQIASKRWQQTPKDKRECDLKSSIWEDAAKEIRELAIEFNKPEHVK